MHSFNDIHDFNDAGRASHLSNAPSNRTTLLLPVELKCNSILSLSSTIDPSLLRASAPVDEGAQLSAFLPVARVPLILTDSGKHAGGSSEFQSNSVLNFDSQSRSSDAFLHKTNGLGLHLSEERDSKTTTVSQPVNRSRTSSFDGLFHDFANFSSDYLTAQEPFDSFGNYRSVSDGLARSDTSAERKPEDIVMTAHTSRISPLSFCATRRFEFSHASGFSSPPQPFGASDAFKDLPSFTGLVADINMFDKESDNGICVRPQDLMGDIILQEVLEPSCSGSVKVEDALDDTSDDSIEFQASALATPRYLKTPQPDWPQIPAEHLPFLVERYLAHFVPGPIPEQFDDKQYPKLEEGFASQPGDPSTQPYTPITAEILEAVEERKKLAEEPITFRRRLADKTNVQRLAPAARPGVNILDMYEFVVPQDVTLERAHEGIPVATVAQKTKHFSMTHPGERLTEELLFSFAGRLNASGQQMPGYRCYVQGCSKTTKRKDHMADHVRTHLGEKPFQCSVCGMGFIRNNDCQRHENNHRPDKKFVCTCKAAFSRRDLFVRHQKTVCAMGNGIPASGCIRRARKVCKTSTGSGERKGTPDGDDANDFDYVPGDPTWTAVSS